MLSDCWEFFKSKAENLRKQMGLLGDGKGNLWANRAVAKNAPEVLGVSDFTAELGEMPHSVFFAAGWADELDVSGMIAGSRRAGRWVRCEVTWGSSEGTEMRRELLAKMWTPLLQAAHGATVTLIQIIWRDAEDWEQLPQERSRGCGKG